MRFAPATLLLPLLLCSCTKAQKPVPSLAPDSGGPTFVVDAKDLPKKLHIIAFGDVRFTDPGNTGPSNPEARQAVVKKIAEEKPDALLVSGDLPYDGGRGSDWRIFDDETKAWRDAALRIYPALGNHELVGDDSHALNNWWQRFPALKGRRWYSVQFANCYLIALDSDTGLAQGTPQRRWLETQLAHIPGDADFVILELHHPSYTASSDHLLGGGHAARPQEQKLGAMLEQLQPKMRARLIEIAGHVHNYERYEHAGVTYVVSGGGGAKPYIFRRSPEDKYQGSGMTYHYVDISVDGNLLKAKMMKWEGAGWAARDRFELTAASPQKPAVSK